MALNGTTIGVVIDLAATFTSVITEPTGSEHVVRPSVATADDLPLPPAPTQTRVPLPAFTRTGQHR